MAGGRSQDCHLTEAVNVAVAVAVAIAVDVIKAVALAAAESVACRRGPSYRRSCRLWS